MFLSKDVDVVITDKITGHCKHLNSLKGTAYMKRSGQLLLLANAAPQSGSSSVLHVASKWNIKIVKYNMFYPVLEALFPIKLGGVQNLI